MPKRKFQIEGGDDASYGTKFGPVVAEEIGEVTRGWGGPFLLVRLLSSAAFQGEPVEFMMLAPRSVGDTLDTIRHRTCAVCLARVRPGMLEEARKEVRFENTRTIAVGASKPVP
jgi:hypothetical protein